MRLYEDYLIDGLPIPVPDADVEMSASDLDSSESGRDESGVMHRILIRERVRTWGFHYSQLTAEEYQYLRSLFAGKSEFIFSYRDVDGYLVSTQAYCSNESIVFHNARLGIYRNLKFSIIEC